MTSPLSAAHEAMKTHVATSRHAEMLFEILTDLLGDQGVVWTGNEGRLRRLFRRDPLDASLVIPWPVAQLSVGGRIGWVSPTIDTRTGEIAPEPEIAPGKPSKLRGLGSAEIGLFDGSASIGLVFGESGAHLESRVKDRHPSRLPEIPLALSSKRAQPVELIAACVAFFDPSVHGPGRVQMPVPVPGGPDGTWQVGLLAARRALFSGSVPDGARYVVADGIAGSAVGFGATLPSAMAAFETRVRASPPAPDTTMTTAWDDYDEDGNLLRRGSADGPEAAARPAGPPGSIDLSGGPIRITGPAPDVPLPPITAASVPRAIVPLAASPPFAPPLGRWVRTIGARGATAHVSRLVRKEGFLQVGERALWRANLRTLDADLDEVDERSAEMDAALREAHPYKDYVRFHSRTYHWTEASDRHPARFESPSPISGPLFDGSTLDGDVEAYVVRRHVKVPRPT